MRKLLFLVLMSLAIPTQANARGKHLSTGKVNKLNAVALNGAAATRTFTWGGNRARGYAYAVFWVKFVHANNGAITIDCTASHDENSTDYETSVCSMSGATCTLSLDSKFVTASLSANQNYMFTWGILGARDFECVASHGGSPAAGDTLTVDVELITQ